MDPWLDIVGKETSSIFLSEFDVSIDLLIAPVPSTDGWFFLELVNGSYDISRVAGCGVLS